MVQYNNLPTVKKVLILGIDALEYTLVEKWDLKNLKQREYGKTVLPIHGKDYIYDLPATTIMWPSFITGKPPAEHGITTIKVWDLKLLTWISKRRYVKQKNKFSDVGGEAEIRELTTVRKILDKLNIHERYPEKKKKI